MGKAIRSTWAQLSLRVIPALSPTRRVRAKLPGCRHPEVAARRGQGGADAPLRPHPREHPAAHLLNRDLLAGLRGRVISCSPRAEVPRTGDSSSDPGDLIRYESNLVTLVRRFRQLEK
jgi:hypothetical protein